MPIGERRATPGRLDEAARALETLEVMAARVVFDRIHESTRTVALCGSETMRGAVRLQAEIRTHLLAHGIALPPYAFHPHITLSYRRDGLGDEAIDPISWLIEEISLIESVHGESRYIEHDRWPLRIPVAKAA